MLCAVVSIGRNAVPFAAGLALILAAACTPSLSGPVAPPAYPVEGLWRALDANEAEAEAGQLLYITATNDAEYPYQFIWYSFRTRELTLSGKQFLFTRREGLVQSSGAELLLLQQKFSSGRIPNAEVGGASVWPAAGYQPTVVERAFEKSYPADVLRFAAEGQQLLGGEAQFERALQPAAADRTRLHLAPLEAGLVFQIDVNARRAAVVSFSPALLVQGSMRDVWRDGQRAGRIRILALAAPVAEAALVEGDLKPGDAIVPADWKPTGGTVRLTRSEVLRRLQRGEPVPREDLIRVLGDDAVRKPAGAP